MMPTNFDVIASLPDDILNTVLSEWVLLKDFRALLILITVLRNGNHHPLSQGLYHSLISISPVFLKQTQFPVQNPDNIGQYLSRLSSFQTRHHFTSMNSFLLKLTGHQLGMIISNKHQDEHWIIKTKTCFNIIRFYHRSTWNINAHEIENVFINNLQSKETFIQDLVTEASDFKIAMIQALSTNDRILILSEYFAKISTEVHHREFMALIHSTLNEDEKIELFSNLMLNPCFVSSKMACRWFLKEKNWQQASPYIQMALNNPIPNFGLIDYVDNEPNFNENIIWPNLEIHEVFFYHKFNNDYYQHFNNDLTVQENYWHQERACHKDHFEEIHNTNEFDLPLYKSLYLMLYDKEFTSSDDIPPYEEILTMQETNILALLNHPENYEKKWHANFLSSKERDFYRELCQSVNVLVQDDVRDLFLKRIIEGFRQCLHDTKISIPFKINIVIILYSLAEDYQITPPELDIIQFLYRALVCKPSESILQIRNICILLLDSPFFAVKEVHQEVVSSTLYSCLKEALTDEKEQLFNYTLWLEDKHIKSNIFGYLYILNTLVKLSPQLRSELLYHYIFFIIRVTQYIEDEKLFLELDHDLIFNGFELAEISKTFKENFKLLKLSSTAYQIIENLFIVAERKQNIRPIQKYIVIEDSALLISQCQNLPTHPIIEAFVDCLKNPTEIHLEILRATLQFFKIDGLKIDTESLIQPLQNLLLENDSVKINALQVIVSMRHDIARCSVMNRVFEVVKNYQSVSYQKLKTLHRILQPDAKQENIGLDDFILPLHAFLTHASSESISELNTLLRECLFFQYQSFMFVQPSELMNACLKLLDSQSIDFSFKNAILFKCFKISPMLQHITPANTQRIYQIMEKTPMVNVSMHDVITQWICDHIKFVYKLSQEECYFLTDAISKKPLDTWPHLIHQRIELLLTKAFQSDVPMIKNIAKQFFYSLNILNNISMVPCSDMQTFNHRLKTFNMLIQRSSASGFHIFYQCLINLIQMDTSNSNQQLSFADFNQLIGFPTSPLETHHQGTDLVYYLFHKICLFFAEFSPHGWASAFIHGLLLDVYTHESCSYFMQAFIYNELHHISNCKKFNESLNAYNSTEVTNFDVLYRKKPVEQNYNEMIKSYNNFFLRHLIKAKFNQNAWQQLQSYFSIQDVQHKTFSKQLVEMISSLETHNELAKNFMAQYHFISQLEFKVDNAEVSKWLEHFDVLHQNYIQNNHQFNELIKNDFQQWITSHFFNQKILVHIVNLSAFTAQELKCPRKLTGYPLFSDHPINEFFLKVPADRRNKTHFMYDVNDNLVIALLSSFLNDLKTPKEQASDFSGQLLLTEHLEYLLNISQRTDISLKIKQYIMIYLAITCNQLIHSDHEIAFSQKLLKVMQNTHGFLNQSQNLHAQIIHYFQTHTAMSKPEKELLKTFIKKNENYRALMTIEKTNIESNMKFTI